MAFDGGSLAPLDYKGLSEWGVSDGTVAEPTGEALARFLESVAAVRGDDEAKPAGEDALTVIYKATSDLCSGTPTAEQFAVLPVRIFRAFVQWLVGEFTDPKE